MTGTALFVYKDKIFIKKLGGSEIIVYLCTLECKI